MQHTLQLEGLGVRLRPVRMDDAAFIVWLRNLAHAQGKVGDSAKDEDAQKGWLELYFQREGDYYFIIETAGGLPVGAYGIYNLENGSAESGRWVIRPEVPAAIPCAILAFDACFDVLGLNQIRVSTVITNKMVLSLNRKLGFRQTHIQPAAQTIGGQPVDLVHFVLDAEDWPKVRAGILGMAKVAERHVLLWEAEQGVESLHC